MKKTLLAVLLSMTFATAAAKEMEINATGTVAVDSGNPQTVKIMAFKKAKRKAIIAGINRVNGAGSTDTEAVQDKIESILDQVNDDLFINRKGQTVGDDYEMSLTLIIDDKEFKTLVLDAGIATNATTAKSYAILVLMDEFFTLPSEINAPLEELVEFSSEQGSSFKDKSRSASSSKESSVSGSRNAATVSARASSSASGSGAYNNRLDASSSGRASASARNGSGSARASASGSNQISARESGRYAGAQSQSAQYKGASSSSNFAASSSKESASNVNNIAAEDHNNVHYTKLVKYQPHNRAPEKMSLAYAALKGQLQDYGMKVLDNDLFRSQYFKNKPITIEQLQNSEENSKYVQYAKKEANADFFMVGSSIIIDSGKNEATGENICTAIMTIKTYSTVSGEDIASETVSETASGINTNNCAAAAAKKLAEVGGPIIGSRIQDHWKRSKMYGAEYVLTLTGQNLSLMSRMAFSKAVKSVPGVEGDIQRASSDKEYQLVVTYKGSDPLDQAVAMRLMENPIFASLDSRTEANEITLCLGACAKPAAATTEKGKKK